MPPLSVHFPSSLTCPPLAPSRTICFVSARIVSRVSLSNAPRSFRSFHSFHSFHKKTHLHPADCKGFIHSAKKSVLVTPPESDVCALIYKMPSVYPTVAPNPFLFFPQPLNIERKETPATPFLSNAYFTVLCFRTFSLIPSIPGSIPSLNTARAAISSLFSGPAHPTGADQIHTGPPEEKT